MFGVLCTSGFFCGDRPYPTLHTLQDRSIGSRDSFVKTLNQRRRWIAIFRNTTPNLAQAQKAGANGTRPNNIEGK